MINIKITIIDNEDIVFNRIKEDEDTDLDWMLMAIYDWLNYIEKKPRNDDYEWGRVLYERGIEDFTDVLRALYKKGLIEISRTDEKDVK